MPAHSVLPAIFLFAVLLTPPSYAQSQPAWCANLKLLLAPSDAYLTTLSGKKISTKDEENLEGAYKFQVTRSTSPLYGECSIRMSTFDLLDPPRLVCFDTDIRRDDQKADMTESVRTLFHSEMDKFAREIDSCLRIKHKRTLARPSKEAPKMDGRTYVWQGPAHQPWVLEIFYMLALPGVTLDSKQSLMTVWSTVHSY